MLISLRLQILKLIKFIRVSANALAGGDYHQVIKASDGTIPEEDIKRYYDIVMKTGLARRLVLYTRNEKRSKNTWL